MSGDLLGTLRKLLAVHDSWGSPVSSALRPGVGHQEVLDHLTGVFGSTTPTVSLLADLWSWHDGTNWVGAVGDAELLPTGGWFTPFDRARSIHAIQAEDLDVAAVDPPWWRQTWWPVLKNAGAD